MKNIIQQIVLCSVCFTYVFGNLEKTIIGIFDPLSLPYIIVYGWYAFFEVTFIFLRDVR